MGKIAFVFSGQGAQTSGMGKDWYDASPAAREVFAVADEVLGYSVSQMCFTGEQEDLNRTIYTQPCVLAVDIAAARALMEKGIRPDGCAGFSLGEFAALAVAGAFDDRTAFSLIARRALYMQEACKQAEGGMVAVLGADAADVEALCESCANVWVVNYNCPGQIVVSGLKEDLDRFVALAAEKKMRVTPLATSGAFHTKVMASAAPRLMEDLLSSPFLSLSVPVYGNTLAKPYPTDAQEARELLSKQLMNPVRWEQSIRAMAAQGYDTFVECGPGKTLTGFFKRMKLDVRAATATELYAEG